jgi:hypothetical protein
MVPQSKINSRSFPVMPVRQNSMKYSSGVSPPLQSNCRLAQLRRTYSAAFNLS